MLISSMKTTLQALSVPILNFSYMPDLSGLITPPEAHVIYAKKIYVMFDDPSKRGNIVGEAEVRRVKDQLIADLTLHTVMKPAQRAVDLISQLFPAACFKVLSCTGNIILQFQMEFVLLTPNGNSDLSILPLGSAVKQMKADLH